MPPKQSASTAQRGRPAASRAKPKAATSSRAAAAAADKSSTAASKAKAKGKQPARSSPSPEPDDDDDDDDHGPMDVDGEETEDGVRQDAAEDDDDSDDEPEKTIPSALLTRILHEFFDKDDTRITSDANNAVAKYMDVFVREAIARAAAERDGGFLEVEDLEKIAPQLLLDL